MFSSATQPPRWCPPPPRHNFVVSAITFEGFKLRSSSLTHALLIQISRTSSIIDIVVPSKKKLRIDLKWPEMRSKVIFRHPKWPTAAILSKISKKIKLRIDLKWPEMQSKVNFGHPKWPTSAILSKISKKIKVAYRSEMARNAIESEIRTSKMADVSHLSKISK